MMDAPRLSDLRFTFGTRQLKPKTFWLCAVYDCKSPCSHEAARLVVESEDGVHIQLELEHTQ